MYAKGADGFTLIELLVTVAVAAIVATVALPSFITTIRDNRMAAQTNELLAAVNLARSEAAKRQAEVRVCAGGPACDGAWGEGWVVYDPGRGEIVRSWAAPDAALSLASVPGGSMIAFNSRGWVDARRSLVFCDARGATAARALNIAATGRVALARREGGAGDSIVDDVEGKDVQCP